MSYELRIAEGYLSGRLNLFGNQKNGIRALGIPPKLFNPLLSKVGKIAPAQK
jgi:hypothetical protein